MYHPPFPTCRPVKAAPCPTFVPAQIGTLESATHNPTSPRPKSCWAGRSASNSTHGMAPLRDGTKADLRTGTDPATGYLSGGLPATWSPAADFSVTPPNRHRRLRPRPAEKFAAAARGCGNLPTTRFPAADFSVTPANRHRRLRSRPAEKFAAAARGLRSIAYLCYALNQEERKWQTII